MERNWNCLACAALLSLSATAMGQAPEAQDRTELTSQKTFYIEVPAAGNPLSNWMIGAAVAKATWMQDLTRLMGMDADAPLTLVVTGKSDHVAQKALQAALESFEGRRLPYLSLTLIGDPRRGEKLRSQAEALGIRYQVQPSSDSSK
jgi:hypothetical protein